MEIKNGDILELKDGTKVKITLEEIKQEIKELIPNKVYKLKYTNQFCHFFEYNQHLNESDIDKYDFIYVGKINVQAGERYIFFTKHSHISAYLMFSTKNLKFVVKEVL